MSAHQEATPHRTIDPMDNSYLISRKNFHPRKHPEKAAFPALA